MSPRPDPAVYPTLDELARGMRNSLATWRTGMRRDGAIATAANREAEHALAVIAQGSPLARGRLLVKARLAIRQMCNGGLETPLVDVLPASWRTRALAADAQLRQTVETRWLRPLPPILPPERQQEPPP